MMSTGVRKEATGPKHVKKGRVVWDETGGMDKSMSISEPQFPQL